MSNITSTVKSGGISIPVSTQIDPNGGNSANLSAHISQVASTGGVEDGDKITTTWPGLPEAVVTERRPSETFSAWLLRHEDRCAAAATAHPIA